MDELHYSISSLLTSIKVEFDYLPELSRDEIIKVLPKYDGLKIRSKTKVDKELIENAKDNNTIESEKFSTIINRSAKNTLNLLDNLLSWAKSQIGMSILVGFVSVVWVEIYKGFKRRII